jgi:hypothetical protein
MRSLLCVKPDRSVFGIAALLLSSCQTAQLGPAADLAKAGETSSQTISDYFADTRADLPAVLEIEVLRSSLEPGISPPSPAMEAAIGQIRKSLALREKLAHDLSTLYGSMYELASTDYPGKFQSSAQQLFGDVSALGQAAHVAVPITDAEVNFVSGLLAKLVRLKQQQKVKAANEIVLTQLQAVQRVLAADRTYVTSLRKATAHEEQDAAIALWNTGTVSAKPLLSKYGNITGLSVLQSDAEFTAKNPALREAVPTLIRYRFKQLDAAEEARYDAMDETIAGLIARHEELRKGAPLNLDWLLNQVATLQALKDQFKALRSSGGGGTNG